MTGNYILDAGGNPVHEPDMLKWARWFSEHTNERQVARTQLPGDVTVSTVFLGLDHSFEPGVILLFETMIFNGPLDETQCRYSTREQALAGHEYYVAAAKYAAGGEVGG
jgi:hypothetical protein